VQFIVKYPTREDGKEQYAEWPMHFLECYCGISQNDRGWDRTADRYENIISAKRWASHNYLSQLYTMAVFGGVPIS
jgi:hypothetical protein